VAICSRRQLLFTHLCTQAEGTNSTHSFMGQYPSEAPPVGGIRTMELSFPAKVRNTGLHYRGLEV